MKKRMKIAAAVMAAVMGMSVLSGCGKSETKETAAASAETTEAKENTETKEETAGESAAEEKGDLRQINVVLDWYPNAIHTFIYTAIERRRPCRRRPGCERTFPS